MHGPRQLWDAFVASDPELARLRQAARVTLTAMLAALVLDVIAVALGESTTVALIGVNVAMLGSGIVNDPLPGDQMRTHLLAPVAASAAIAAGTLAAPHDLGRTALLLALVFVAVLVRRYGPRGLALGTISLLACFFSLFFQARPDQLPLMIAGVFVASALGFLVRFGLMRDPPAALLRRRLTGLRRTISALLGELEAAAADGRAAPHVASVQRQLGQINEAALAIEELPDLGLPGQAPGRVLALEVAVEGLVVALRQWLVAPPPEHLRAVVGVLASARRLVEAPSPDALTRALAELEQKRSPELAWLYDELAALFTALRDLNSPVAGEPPPPTTPPPPTPPVPTLRPAIQATVAAALALLLGGLISSERAFWAVLAAFMVFTRANTLGAMLARAWQRTIGTLAGVVVGLVIAELVQGHTQLELAVVFVCMFVAYYTLQVAYAWMVGAFTTLIAVLYSLLGHFSPDLLYLRVLETIVGAGVGAIVAALLYPVHTRPAIRQGMVEALRMLAEHIELVMVHEVAPRTALRGSARALDRKLRDLRTEVQRAAGVPLLRGGRERARVFLAFATIYFHARPLVAADWSSADREPLRAVGVGLAANARALADLLAGAGAPDMTSVAPALEAARARLTTPTTLRWLAALDDALLTLRREVLELDWAGLASKR